jgi:hypothetical protein
VRADLGGAVKLAEVKPLIDKLGNDLDVLGALSFGEHTLRREIRTLLEAAFVAGVRSGLKYTSNAKFAEAFGGKKSDK